MSMLGVEMCEHCAGLILNEEPVPVATEAGASGPGRTVYAHREHAHLVVPDPKPFLLLQRIRARRGLP